MRFFLIFVERVFCQPCKGMSHNIYHVLSKQELVTDSLMHQTLLYLSPTVYIPNWSSQLPVQSHSFRLTFAHFFTQLLIPPPPSPFRSICTVSKLLNKVCCTYKYHSHTKTYKIRSIKQCVHNPYSLCYPALFVVTIYKVHRPDCIYQHLF